MTHLKLPKMSDLIKQFEITTSVKDIQERLQDILKLVDDGQLDKFIALRELTKIDKAFESVNKEIRQRVSDEVENMPNQSYDDGYYEYKFVEGRRVFDFSNDDEWQILSRKLKAREDLMKASFEAYKKGQRFLSEDGEVVPMAAIKPSKSYMRITRSKPRD